MKPFQQYQKEFVDYLRDPQQAKRPEYAAKARIQVYEKLLFNNVSGFVETAFPVLQSIIPDEKWQALMRRFFANHRCQSPFFIEISKQFLDYLIEHELDLQQEYPYLVSLAHYEWLELSVSVRAESQGELVESHHLDSCQLTLSESSEPVSYAFPVHQITQENAHDTVVCTQLQTPVYLVLYRKKNQDSVNFLEVNAVTALVCSFLQGKQVSFEALLTYVHQHLPQFDIQQLTQNLEEMLLYLSSLHIVVQHSQS